MSNELVKFEETDNLPAEMQEELAEKSAENIEGVQPRLPKVIMPTGRGKEFGIEHQAEETEDTKELVGIILYQTTSNAYWSEPYGGGNAVVPDCASHDGIVPSSQYENLQAESCAKCPHNRFGTAKDPEGNKLPGKACRNVKRVVILRGGDDPLPLLLTVPPSSIKAFDDYMVLLRKKKRPYYTVGTKMTVETESNRKGIEFPHLIFEIAGYVNKKEHLDDIMKQQKEWTEMLKMMLFVSDDVAANPDEGTSFSPDSTNVSTPITEF